MKKLSAGTQGWMVGLHLRRHEIVGLGPVNPAGRGGAASRTLSVRSVPHYTKAELGKELTPPLPASSFFQKNGGAWRRLAARDSPWQSFPSPPRSGLKPHATLSPMRDTQIHRSPSTSFSKIFCFSVHLNGTSLRVPACLLCATRQIPKTWCYSPPVTKDLFARFKLGRSELNVHLRPFPGFCLSTLQHSNAPTLERLNASTLQRLNALTVQRLNASTL